MIVVISGYWILEISGQGICIHTEESVLWMADGGSVVFAAVASDRSDSSNFRHRAILCEHDATANNIVERACERCARKKEAAAILAHWNKLRSWQKGSKKILQRRAKGNKNEGRPLGFRGKHKKHQSRHSGEGKK